MEGYIMYIQEDKLMISNVFKLGNSNAIRLPKTVMKSLDIKTNDEVKMTINDNKLTIEKIKKRKNIDELFKDYNGKYEVNELLDDNPVGREVL